MLAPSRCPRSFLLKLWRGFLLLPGILQILILLFFFLF